MVNNDLCQLVLSCVDRDLLITGNGDAPARFLEYDEAAGLITATLDPCLCSSCSVGNTRHGSNELISLVPGEVKFPDYWHLHYWDQDSPITELFRQRSGRCLADTVPMSLVFYEDGRRIHT